MRRSKKKTSRTLATWQKVTAGNLPSGFTLGPINTESLTRDPKHLGFTFARYKFAAKMLADAGTITDIGCGEGIGILGLLNDTGADVTGIDFDEPQIRYAESHISPLFPDRVKFISSDLTGEKPRLRRQEGIVCLDVIEHVHKPETSPFLKNMSALLKTGGTAVFGTPNKASHHLASRRSADGHVSLYDAAGLKKVLSPFFTAVFLFSMNDEMIHTGHYDRAHYLIALCVR